MEVLKDRHGNMFNVAGVIQYEHDPEELRLLCKALVDELDKRTYTLACVRKEADQKNAALWLDLRDAKRQLSKEV